MAGVKFLKRVSEPGVPRVWTQDFDCYICVGKWTAIHYESPEEWYDIRDTADYKQAFGRLNMLVKSVSAREFLKNTGWEGFKKAVNCFFGRAIFKFEDNQKKVVEDTEDKEYTNTDDFFADGPGEDLSGLMPPAIFDGAVKGDKDG